MSFRQHDPMASISADPGMYLEAGIQDPAATATATTATAATTAVGEGEGGE